MFVVVWVVLLQPLPSIFFGEKSVSLIRLKFVLLFLFSTCVQAQSSERHELTLHDSLAAALEKHSFDAFLNAQQMDSKRSYFDWLDGAPSVSVSHYDSQDRMGSNESEISLNLPIKSALLKQSEDNLNNNLQLLRANSQQKYQLYLSGLIRQLVWEIQVEKTYASSAEDKSQAMAELSERYQMMAGAAAIPEYIALIIKKELNDLNLSLLQHQQKLASLQDRYTRLTGLKVLPTIIEEAMITPGEIKIERHPDIILAEAEYQHGLQQLLAQSNQAAPWNVQVSGRRIKNADLTENQIGIGLEIPIGVGNRLTPSQRSEYQKLQAQYQLSVGKQILSLRESVADRFQEYHHLTQKQRLLDEGSATLQQLRAELQKLRDANAINHEFVIRTLLDSFDSALQIEVNRLFIQRQKSLLRQAAGIVL